MPEYFKCCVGTHFRRSEYKKKINPLDYLSSEILEESDTEEDYEPSLEEEDCLAFDEIEK